MDTCRTAEELIRPAVDPERIIRGNKAGSSTAAMTEGVGKVCPTGREDDTSEVISSMILALAPAEAARIEEKESESRIQLPIKTGYGPVCKSVQGIGRSRPRYQHGSREGGRAHD